MLYGPSRILLTCLIISISIFTLPPAASLAEPPDFSTWLAEFRDEAAKQGISNKTLELSLADLAPIPRVLELDRNQPEVKKTFEQYLNMMISQHRITSGRENLQLHKKLLESVGKKFGVPPHILVALWGIESNFGKVTGSFPVIGALATLAHDQRRAAFFRKELLAALTLLDRGVVNLQEMKGSWAGAMGQLQFLPSVLAGHGEDFDSDGHIAIWQSSPDLFATGARYLAASGWQRGQTWGLEVKTPVDFSPADQPKEPLPIKRWLQLGFQPLQTQNDLDQMTHATLLTSDDDRTFLVMQNFSVLLHWNRSNKYVLAVGLLADRIANEQGK